jgi:hypothetical protein
VESEAMCSHAHALNKARMMMQTPDTLALAPSALPG